MKKFSITLFIIIIIVLTVLFNFKESPNSEYLRIHIRANSNLAIDQEIKYKVRDSVVELLTPLLCNCNTKEKAKLMVIENIDLINRTVKEVLNTENCSYNAKTSLKKEEFPHRIYGDLVLEAGTYDAVIVELGEGGGANWWCVVYPPLCFTGEGSGAIKYRSKILEIIKNFKEKRKLT